jgi:hypothetical protein
MLQLGSWLLLAAWVRWFPKSRLHGPNHPDIAGGIAGFVGNPGGAF